MSYAVLEPAQTHDLLDLSCCPYNFHETWLDPLDDELDALDYDSD